MFIYIFIFFVSFLFAYCARKFYSNKKMFYLFSFFAILIPSLLAGLRTIDIGTDTKGYVETAFVYTKNYKNIIECMINVDIEPLYSALNYIVHIFTDNIHYLYFLIELLILFFTYVACVKNDDNNKKFFPIYFIIFLLLYYNRSLNMVRQSISLSIFLLAFYYLKENKTIKYFLLTLLAIGFHNSSFIMIPLYFLYRFINNNKKNKIIVFIVFLILVVFYSKIGIFLLNVFSFIPRRYIFYFTKSSVRTLLIPELLFKICTLIFGFVFIKKINDKNKNNSNIIYLLLLDFLIYFLAIKFNYAQRVSYYFGYLNIFILPYFIYAFTNDTNHKKKYVLISCLLLLLSIYSFLFYGIRKYDETYPYKSIINYEDKVGGKKK